jgi:hypothetical protein
MYFITRPVWKPKYSQDTIDSTSHSSGNMKIGVVSDPSKAGTGIVHINRNGEELIVIAILRSV